MRSGESPEKPVASGSRYWPICLEKEIPLQKKIGGRLSGKAWSWMRAAILRNVGTLISFRVGAEDAKYLSREFYPVFNEADLVNLANHHIYLKLMIDGVTSRPFSAETLPAPEIRQSFKEEIIEQSRKRYATVRKKAENGFHPVNPLTSEKTANRYPTDRKKSQGTHIFGSFSPREENSSQLDLFSSD